MTAHGLAVIEGGASWTASCTCGWTTTPAHSETHARARLRFHVTERRAVAATERAQALSVETERQRQQLAERRAAAVARRGDLRTQRARLQATISVARQKAGSEEPPEVVLAAARVLAGLTEDELWLDYLGLGGQLAPQALHQALDGSVPLADIDHDVVAVALNERFADAGFGHPLPVWGYLQDVS